MYVYEPILIALGSYLLGSIPFGVLLAKLFKLPDPRTIGSGNIGATNMLRTGKKKVALLTLLLDGGKGAAAVYLTRHVGGDDGSAALALLCAALGHMYSPWLKFTGGKGIATIIGAALTFSFPVGLACCAVWLAVFLLTHYVSLASILAMAAIPIAAHLINGPGDATGWLALAALIAMYKHKANLARLKAGTEPKMMGKKKERA